MKPHRAFIIVFFSLLCAAFLIVSCSKDDNDGPTGPEINEPPEIETESQSEDINADSGGEIELTDGTKLEIPADALTNDTKITITSTEPPRDENEAQDRGYTEPANALSNIVTIEPDIENLNYRARITIPYINERVSGNFSASDLVIYTATDEGWEVLDSVVVDQNNQTVTGVTSHFSSFHVGVRGRGDLDIEDIELSIENGQLNISITHEPPSLNAFRNWIGNLGTPVVCVWYWFGLYDEHDDLVAGKQILKSVMLNGAWNFGGRTRIMNAGSRVSNNDLNYFSELDDWPRHPVQLWFDPPAIPPEHDEVVSVTRGNAEEGVQVVITEISFNSQGNASSVSFHDLGVVNDNFPSATQLQIDEDNNPVPIIHSNSLGNEEYRIRGEIEFFWGGGEYSGSFRTDEFTKIQIESGGAIDYNRPPSEPYSPSPYHNSNYVRNVVLRWSCSDPENDDLTYDIWFGPYAPQLIEENFNGTMYPDITEHFNLQSNTRYNWKIVARDEHGAETESPTWRFTTGTITPTNRAPSAPSNPSPSHQATNQSTDANLSWSCSDPDSDPLTYDVYFGTDSSPDNSEYKGNQSQTTYDPGNLVANTTYYWKIVAKDDYDHSTEGSIWRFTTTSQGGDDTEPPVVEITSPPPGAAVFDSIEIVAEATDNEGVERVVFEVYEGNQYVEVGEDRTPSGDEYSISWNTTEFSNGDHNIHATAYDAAGNNEFAGISVTVDNEAEVQDPTLEDYELDPAQPGVYQGGSFTARYQVNNPNDFDIDILLDARWRSGAGAYGELEPVTHEVTLEPGSNWYERACNVPDDMEPGVYSFAWYLLWTDNSDITHSGYIANSFEVLEYDMEEREFNLTDDVTITMIWIPAGEFMMGAQEGEQDSGENEYPRHEVTISQGFWLGKYEVTQAQWEAVLGENPARNYGVGNDHPVYYVSWNDIHDDYLPAINATEDGNPWRFPSEAEWEYACRAGTTTRFYWGDDPNYTDIGDYAVYRDNDPGGTAEVGTKLPNGWGLYDMSGNVYEWCEDDWHGNYDDAPADGLPWIDRPRGAYRVLRGGGWRSFNGACRSAFRGSFYPSYRIYYIGFRLVRSGN